MPKKNETSNSNVNQEAPLFQVNLTWSDLQQMVQSLVATETEKVATAVFKEMRDVYTSLIAIGSDAEFAVRHWIDSSPQVAEEYEQFKQEILAKWQDSREEAKNEEKTTTENKSKKSRKASSSPKKSKKEE